MSLLSNPTFEIQDAQALTEKIKDYIFCAKSAQTRKAYRSDWNEFEKWCVDKGLVSIPAEPTTIAAYLADLASSKKAKVSTIERRLVSIRQGHNLAGHPLNKNDPYITETLKGIKNVHGAPQETKQPILTEDLRFMIRALGSDVKGLRDKALLLTGFTGAFRRSELVSLCYGDLNLEKKEGIEILLKKSKTDQQGKGEPIPIPYGSNPETCPVRAIRDWLDRSGIKEGPIFRAINKHGHISLKGMSSASVALIIKRNEHIKNKKSYSGHSLRAGFCTQAAANGVSDTQGMKHSRHKKFDTWRKYVRRATVWQDNASAKLGL